MNCTFEDLKALNDRLNEDNVRLCGEIVTIRNKARDRILSRKAEVRQEITSVKMILTAIKEGKSSHWQKKENIRLALEIIETIPTFDRGEFFNYEDDF
jgi:tartrate dehydratase beta subunit/fumarate hydratase class I family protein